MTMVEKVAQAIEAAWVESANQPGAAYNSEVLARAAIAAMREPTERMILACRAERPPARTIEDWQAMIDTVLMEE
jgi:hypothetical protein